VTLSVATEHASLPVACRLYLPEVWADDPVDLPALKRLSIGRDLV
jgi:SRSO17 transposase